MRRPDLNEPECCIQNVETHPDWTPHACGVESRTRKIIPSLKVNDASIHCHCWEHNYSNGSELHSQLPTWFKNRGLNTWEVNLQSWLSGKSQMITGSANQIFIQIRTTNPKMLWISLYLWKDSRSNHLDLTGILFVLLVRLFLPEENAWRVKENHLYDCHRLTGCKKFDTI